MKRIIYILVFLTFVSNAQELSFYGAEGFGKHTQGGKGGTVYHVNTLADTGLGSFRAACNASGARTIVFDISGYIDLSTNISINNGNLTIAGETAPDGGITIKGGRIRIRDENVVMRHIRVRPGSTSNDNEDAIQVFNEVSNGQCDIWSGFMFDHLSISFSTDENMDLFPTTGCVNAGGGLENITVQNCMIGAPIDNSYNFLIGARVDKLSFIGNYWPHAKDRSPRIGYGINGTSTEVVNNVVYDYNECTAIVYGNVTDMLGNVYKKRTVPSPNFNPIRWTNDPDNPQVVFADGSVYGEHNFSINVSAQNGGFNTKASANRVVTNSFVDNWMMAESQIVDSVLANAGANLYRDTLDDLMVSDYASNSGSYIPNSSMTESHFGGYPALASNIRPANYYHVNSPDISADFYNEHGLSGDGSNVTTNWTFENKSFPNTEGLSDFEMYLGFLAGDFENIGSGSGSGSGLGPDTEEKRKIFSIFGFLN